jgi:integrase
MNNITKAKTELELLIENTKGIDVHGKKFRISFYNQNTRYFEVFKQYAVTETNLNKVIKKRDNVIYRIETNCFDYAEEFPTSKKALKFRTKNIKIPTVKIAIEAFLILKELTSAHSSYTSYASKAKHILKKWADHQIDDITPYDIEMWIATDLKKISNKTINDIMIVFRGIYLAAIKGNIMTKTPFEHIKNLPIIRREPKPFTTQEIYDIETTETEQQQEVNAFIFNCWTGVRPSELISMAWEDVDTKNWTVKIQRANVKSRYKCTKNEGSTRTINLIEPAIKMLKKQMKYSYLREPQEVSVLQLDHKTIVKEKIRMVFLNTNTDAAYPCIGSFKDRFFKKHLEKANIEYRSAGQARHTFASQLLTAGVNHLWLAGQMGHKSIKMLELHYGKWMKEEAPGIATQVSQLLNVNLKQPKKLNQPSQPSV